MGAGGAAKRIVGIDVARALAVIGMIIVNFKMVFGDSGGNILTNVTQVFDGKAAATFVVLAGVGIALMTNSAFRARDGERLSRVRTGILKRALFLFVIGLIYLPIWPADILHFYGIYMAITVFFLKSSERVILLCAVLLAAVYPALMAIWDYELGWDFTVMEYHNFWTLNGFFRNLLFNGYHPVFPWTAFMLVGLWFGRKNLQRRTVVQKALWISLAVFLVSQLISYGLTAAISGGDPVVRRQLLEVP